MPVILCLGEAIVDLVCERELDAPSDAEEFRPCFGGALANVAVAARRAGADAGLAGGVGDDPFGKWLRGRLAEEGVSLEWFSSVQGVNTPISVITFDRDREPDFHVYDEGIAETLCSAEPQIEAAIDAAEALLFGSNTLFGERERALTMRARELALERGIPVLFDPNLRHHRWHDLEQARQLCLDVCDGLFCLRANAEEAAWLAGSDASDEGEAALAIAAHGAVVAVVTRGPNGAIARGAADADSPGIETDVLSPLGAGDAFFGTLAAGYARRGWELGATAEVIDEANRAGARACTTWRAVS